MGNHIKHQLETKTSAFNFSVAVTETGDASNSNFCKNMPKIVFLYNCSKKKLPLDKTALQFGQCDNLSVSI